MKDKPVIEFGGLPCYLENKKLDNSNKIGECVIDDIDHIGYMTKRSNSSYLYVVKKTINNEKD